MACVEVEDVDLGGAQAASLAEALAIDAMTLDATESLSQFTDLLMSPGGPGFCLMFWLMFQFVSEQAERP